jgi:hypothetical protein
MSQRQVPRPSPQGEQVDITESMDIRNGKIAYHRVYFGWHGFKALVASYETNRARQH